MSLTYKRSSILCAFLDFFNNDHRSSDKAGIYIDAEAEAKAKFMLLLQTLFTLKQKQKHGGRSYGCESTAIYSVVYRSTFHQWHSLSGRLRPEVGGRSRKKIFPIPKLLNLWMEDALFFCNQKLDQ